MVRLVECVHCHQMTPAGASKGEGALAGKNMTHLTDSQRETLGFMVYLQADSRQKAVTSEMLEDTINTDRAARKGPDGKPKPDPPRRSNAIGGDLSMMQGAGLVDQDRAEVEMKDPSTQTVRHFRTPVWWYLPPARKALETGQVKAPLFEEPIESVPDSLPEGA